MLWQFYLILFCSQKHSYFCSVLFIFVYVSLHAENIVHSNTIYFHEMRIKQATFAKNDISKLMSSFRCYLRLNS